VDCLAITIDADADSIDRHKMAINATAILLFNFSIPCQSKLLA
jgi:hypothetical protein